MFHFYTQTFHTLASAVKICTVMNPIRAHSQAPSKSGRSFYDRGADFATKGEAFLWFSLKRGRACWRQEQAKHEKKHTLSTRVLCFHWTRENHATHTKHTLNTLALSADDFETHEGARYTPVYPIHIHVVQTHYVSVCLLSRVKRIYSFNCTYMQVMMTYNTLAYTLDMYLNVRYTIKIPIFNIVRTRNRIHHTCGAFVEFRACLGYSVEHGLHILPPCTFEVGVSALPCYFAEY